MAFGANEKMYDHIVNSQREAVILPSADVSPSDERKKEEIAERVPKLGIREFGNDVMINVVLIKKEQKLVLVEPEKI